MLLIHRTIPIKNNTGRSNQHLTMLAIFPINATAYPYGITEDTVSVMP